MIPVPDEVGGDCFRACLASILEVPLDEVPRPSGDDWVERYDDWLAPRGLALAWATEPFTTRRIGPMIGVVEMADVPGALHALVLDGGRVVHDPARVPGRHGAWRWGYYLVALDPAALFRAGLSGGEGQ